MKDAGRGSSLVIFTSISSPPRFSLFAISQHQSHAWTLLITYGVIILPVWSMRDDVSMTKRRLMTNVQSMLWGMIAVVVVVAVLGSLTRSSVSQYVHLNEESTWNVGTMNHHSDKNREERDVRCCFLLLLPLHVRGDRSKSSERLFLFSSLRFSSLLFSFSVHHTRENSYCIQIIASADFFASSCIGIGRENDRIKRKLIHTFLFRTNDNTENSI